MFPRFRSSKLHATPGVIELELDLSRILLRHLRGDWGDVCKMDAQLNEDALKDGSRLISVYHIDGHKIWVITDASEGENPLEREVTTILLPEEY